ncbi:MAG: LysE/ArgO family amino acid transporter [Pseudomonadota bacterium]
MFDPALSGPALQGFLLGAGLIIAIGAQNAFVLRQGLVREHVLPVVLLCAVSDAILIAAGVLGLGALISQSPILILVATIGGAAFLIAYGLMAARRALKPTALEAAEKKAGSLKQALTFAALFTWANPHVYLDTVVLFGSISAQHQDAARTAFWLGGMSASFVWFFALGYGARLLAPLFASPTAWRVLDGLIALIMFGIATKLLWGALG